MVLDSGPEQGRGATGLEPVEVSPALRVECPAISTRAMSRSKEAIEQGLTLYQDLLGHHPALEEEFARTRLWFAGVAPGPADKDSLLATELAARRHLEWFLLERPSEHLQGIPAAMLREAWLEEPECPGEDFVPTFQNSLAGAFQVTAVDRAQGLWLNDLFGSGEYPVEEPDAAAEIEVGDLLVGRIFPVGDGVFRLSPAAACFRDPALVHAVREDALRTRRARRGVLRIEQLELERLFFGSAPVAAVVPDEAHRHVRRLLEKEGLAEAHIEALFARLEAAARAGHAQPITEILNELAFETELDLEALRLGLVNLWNTIAGPGPPQAGGADYAPPPVPAVEPAVADEPTAAARAALEAFDNGRAAGLDLEELFARLERDLGVADRAEEESEGTAVGESDGPLGPLPDLGEEVIPDFPWAVGAMVEEFLWELSRQPGVEVPPGHGSLRLLSEYGERIGVFENLSARHLLDFAGRWVLDERRLANADAARDLLHALADFCRWCDAEHAVLVTAAFTPLREELERDLPRLVEAQGVPRSLDSGPFASFKVAFVGDGVLRLEDPGGVAHEVPVAEDLAARLRPGDVVQARLEGSGAVLGTVYPAVLERLVDGRI